MALPAKQISVALQLKRRFQTEFALKAYEVLYQALDDENARVRVDSAKTGLAIGGYVAPKAAEADTLTGKPLTSMSDNELREFIRKRATVIDAPKDAPALSKPLAFLDYRRLAKARSTPGVTRPPGRGPAAGARARASARRNFVDFQTL